MVNFLKSRLRLRPHAYTYVRYVHAVDSTRLISFRFHLELGISQRRHVCQSCGKDYARAAHLCRHLTEECGKEGQFIVCGLCGKRMRSKRKDSFIAHLKKAHSIDGNYANALSYASPTSSITIRSRNQYPPEPPPTLNF